jgi:hypothetical protein
MVFAFTGCGSDLATVEGTVLLDGKPLDHGSVTLQADGMAMGVGQIQSDGTFDISTGTQRGILPGKYVATVTAYQTSENNDSVDPIPALLTPEKYNSTATSKLSADITAGHNLVKFELKSDE